MQTNKASRNKHMDDAEMHVFMRRGSRPMCEGNWGTQAGMFMCRELVILYMRYTLFSFVTGCVAGLSYRTVQVSRLLSSEGWELANGRSLKTAQELTARDPPHQNWYNRQKLENKS